MNSMQEYYESFAQIDLVDLIARFSLLLMLFYSGHYWFTEIPLSLLFILSFIFPKLSKSSQFWFAAFSFSFFEVVFYWHSADNHMFLITYWFLSLAIIFTRPTVEHLPLLRTHGKTYLVGCMLFAVLWKVTASDFASGEFFEFTLLTDKRFFYFARVLTDISGANLLANQVLFADFFLTPESTVKLFSTPTLERVAAFMATFTILIELLIPLAFLFLGNGRRNWIAHMALVTFVLATYPAASVIGFAWLLILFAMTQCHPQRDRKWVALYCLLYVVTQAFRLRYGEIGDTFLGGL